MMRALRPLLLVLLAGLALPAVARAAGSSDQAVEVGILATLSGPQGIAGQDVADGFNLALKQLGGRFSNQEIRVTVADDKGSPDGVLAAWRDLQEQDRLDVVVTSLVPASLATVMPALTAARVFVLNTQPASVGFSGGNCSAALFDLGGQAEGVFEATATQMTADHVRRVAVIGPDSVVTDEAVAAFKRAFPGEVVLVLKHRHGYPLFDAEMTAIQGAKPDALFSVLTGGTGGAFVRAWDAAQMKADYPLYGLWTAFERMALPAMGDAALDVATVAPWSADLDSPVNKRFVGEFEVEYGRPATGWAVTGFDAAMALDAALKTTKGRTNDGEAVRWGLRRAEFASLRGAFRFNTNHFPIQTYYLRKVTHDQRGRLVNEMRGIAYKDWRDRMAPACPMRWELPLADPKAKPAKKP